MNDNIIDLANRIRRRLKLDNVPEGVDIQILANLLKDDFVFIRVNCEDRPQELKKVYLQKLYESIKPLVASEVDRVLIMEDNVSMEKIEKGTPYLFRVDLADIPPAHVSEYMAEIKKVVDTLNEAGHEIIVVPANVEVEENAETKD